MHSHSVQRALRVPSAILGVLTMAIVTLGFLHDEGDSTQARLLPAHVRGEIEWLTVTSEELARGKTFPPHTNILFQIPLSVSSISVDVFFGRREKDVRYWGYCFPENPEESQKRLRNGGFPGKVFLSWKERDLRAEKLRAEQRRKFSVFRNLNAQDLNEARHISKGLIRHEKDTLFGGERCFMTTNAPLPVGLDDDRDGANSAVERDAGSAPDKSDTDADGVTDGREIFYLGTSPLKRDTDGDRLIDGVEDKNQNGRVDRDETNPNEWDTDRDGLCDGECSVERGTKIRGEDRNLDGIVGDGESDPLKKDTDGDGIDDLAEVLLCELKGGDDC